MLAYLPGMNVPGSLPHPTGTSAKGSSIFLVGLMGAGKSTIGRQLAELLGMDFADSDQEIERRTGAAIPLIFEIEGEAGFRRREAAVIDELTRRDQLVLGTGGGAVLLEENRRCLRSRGSVVYLCADVDTLLERTRRDRHRPLLQTADPRGKIEELLRQREPLYREVADLVVNTERRSAAAVARDIAKRLRRKIVHEKTPS